MKLRMERAVSKKKKGRICSSTEAITLVEKVVDTRLRVDGTRPPNTKRITGL
jgi:hypothetical protein